MVEMRFGMKKRMISVSCTIVLTICMLLTSVNTVYAATDTPILDGSYLTHDNESIGYDVKITRGVDLLTGCSVRTRRNLCGCNNDSKTKS